MHIQIKISKTQSARFVTTKTKRNEQEQSANLLCPISRQDQIVKATLGAADATALARASAVTVQESHTSDTPGVVKRMQPFAVRHAPHPQGTIIRSGEQLCAAMYKGRMLGQL